jgi:iron(III) transport system permease protein
VIVRKRSGTAENSHRAIGRRNSPLTTRLLGLAALAVSVLLAIPILTIGILGFFPQENVWPHLAGSVLPGYVWRTTLLMAGVGFLTFIIGTGTAWLVTMCSFPGQRAFQWALLVPLALPTYIIAYCDVDFLSYPGPLQTYLRALFGWKSTRDYWFPEIRSMGGAIFVLAMVLYPYVYLTSRASFLRQAPAQLEVARTLGQTALGAFLRIALPLARPAIAVGVSLAMMECLNDLGAVNFFGVRTLSVGIYTTWLSQGNLGGAAQIAAVMLIFVFLLLWSERRGRRHQGFVMAAKQNRYAVRQHLTGAMRWLATLACALPIVLGFIVPALVLSNFALSHLGDAASLEYWRAAAHSMILSATAAAIAAVLGVILAYAQRLSTNPAVHYAIRIASAGYAIPGTVLGIGVLVPFAAFDNSLDRFLRAQFGVSTGLLLSGTIAAVTFAYVVRFLAIAAGTIESGLQRVTPNLAAAARTLGRGPVAAFFEVHLPLLRPALVSAALLVFVDGMKELPATLILRPFDFETLATLVFTRASLDQLEESAIPALTIVATGLIPVILLSRTLRDPRLRAEERGLPEIRP